MALTKNGKVYSWGSNKFGQLGTGNRKDSKWPRYVQIRCKNLKLVSFQKISCGPEHSLLLSLEGDIYVFGRNDFGQLGSKRQNDEIFPLKICSNDKFDDLISHPFFHISSALTVKGENFVWGKCNDKVIKEPKSTKFETFIEIFKYYFQVTVNTIDSEIYDSAPKRRKDKYFKEFKEERLISAGSFGTVFKAIDRNESKIYAIKKIALTNCELEKKNREINIMKKLNSHYVVEYKSSWIENNYYLDQEFKNEAKDSIKYGNRLLDPKYPFLLHIQMEYCSATLKQVIEKDKTVKYENDRLLIDALRYCYLCELLVQILENVRFLHKQNPAVIHRDLKPGNILLSDRSNGQIEERRARIADFGLAVNHDFENQSHTSEQGTIKYMAPEVKKTRKYDTKADIYSLGVIIEEMFNYNEP
jgi:hypothetical protein